MQANNLLFEVPGFTLGVTRRAFRVEHHHFAPLLVMMKF